MYRLLLSISIGMMITGLVFLACCSVHIWYNNDPELMEIFSFPLAAPYAIYQLISPHIDRDIYKFGVNAAMFEWPMHLLNILLYGSVTYSLFFLADLLRGFRNEARIQRK